MSEFGFNDSSFSEQSPEFFRNTPWKEILDLSEAIMKQLEAYSIEAESGNELQRVAWQEDSTARTIDLFSRDLESSTGPITKYRLVVHPLGEGTKEVYIYQNNFRKIEEKDDNGKYFQSTDKDAAERKIRDYLKSSNVVTERMVREEAFIEHLFGILRQEFE